MPHFLTEINVYFIHPFLTKFNFYFPPNKLIEFLISNHNLSTSV